MNGPLKPKNSNFLTPSRRSFLKGGAGLFTPNFSLSQIGIEVPSPVDIRFAGFSSEDLARRWKKLGYDPSLVDSFIYRRDDAIKTCLSKAKSLVLDLIEQNPAGFLERGEIPSIDVQMWNASLYENNRIRGPFRRFPEGSGDEYLKNGKTYISTSFKALKLPFDLVCGQSQSIDGKVILKLDHEGEVRLILDGSMSQETWAQTMGNITSEVIERGPGAAQSIVRVLKSWQVRDWEPLINARVQRTGQLLHRILKVYSEKQLDSVEDSARNEGRSEFTKQISLQKRALMGTTHLTDPKRTISRYKKLYRSAFSLDGFVFDNTEDPEINSG